MSKGSNFRIIASSGITVNNPEVDRVGHRSGKRLKRRFIHLCGVNPGAVFQQFLRKTQLITAQHPRRETAVIYCGAVRG